MPKKNENTNFKTRDSSFYNLYTGTAVIAIFIFYLFENVF